MIRKNGRIPKSEHKCQILKASTTESRKDDENFLFNLPSINPNVQYAKTDRLVRLQESLRVH